VAGLFRAWTNADPPVKRCCAITPKHLRFLHTYASQTKSYTLQALAILTTGAFFFACRSCEYLQVVVRGKTRILCLRNIQFTTSTYEHIPHHNPHLQTKAAFISVIFEDQKNNTKMEKRTQQKSLDHTLCPVRAWAQTIQRILTYPNTTPDTPVNLFIDHTTHQKIYFSQALLNNFLRTTVRQKPVNYFGYTHSNIGTHSIRSGAAMALYLANEPPHKIMLLGRWSSDAFLLYVRPEVLSSFSHLSTNMLNNDDFRQATQTSQTQSYCNCTKQNRTNNRTHTEKDLIP
jgi:hypothetical protein